MASCKPGISSMSLGRAWVHNFPEKLEQAYKYGFQGIEIFFEDLEHLAKRLGDGKGEGNNPALDKDFTMAAQQVRDLCDQYQLEIICLQPFAGYEGLIDENEHQEMIEKVQLWIRLARILRTDIIQIPSNTRQDARVTGDMGKIVADMREIADLGLSFTPPIRFAYENLAWGSHVDTWEAAWEIVERVDKPNFGMCLDTFNITGRIWADPSVESGKNQNAGEWLRASMERMKDQVDVRKIWYVQVVGAERMRIPLSERHPWWKEEQPNRMTWSRNARLFAYEEDRGQYLPIYDVAKVLFEDLRFRGWVSLELFSRTMADPDPSVPKDHAQRGQRSWKLLVENYGLLD
ncbi:putative 3-dehydroshikimate dehydratase [Phaeomoniella chlamydospora]|uniref:Putative 3-dehydroshikimate dehydratase n=1 Tax=Phaeomoniella chlamydospora TaxID=158046 RepID=A0A0G2E614_PHACM|nr:putative 3-dehydroshikimate dehydratase [Phaeomoniella chlamydospora]